LTGAENAGAVPPGTAFLAEITPPVTTALRRCQADTFVVRPAADTRRVLGA
jgi:hypothetical protein